MHAKKQVYKKKKIMKKGFMRIALDKKQVSTNYYLHHRPFHVQLSENSFVLQQMRIFQTDEQISLDMNM